MRLIWATRGWAWGARFLRDGNLGDPLPHYDEVMRTLGDSPAILRRVGDVVAIRFPDPERRQDRAGRVIPHEFIIYPPEADDLTDLESAIAMVWPVVADEYAKLWKPE